MVIWGLKESKASQALQESKALQASQGSQGLRDQWVQEVTKDTMGFLALLEKREKQACWGPIQAQEGILVFQVPKETGDPLAGPASLAGREPWEILGLQDPVA